MTSTPTPGRRVDPVSRGHLTGSDTLAPPIFRYAVPEDLADVARRYWVPVWDFTDRPMQPQRTLQSPVPLLVVSDGYARLYGVNTGMSTIELHDRGWALGLMLQPAAGALLWGGPLTELTDTWVDLVRARGMDAELVAEVRAAMTPDPMDPVHHADARAVVEDRLRALGSPDETGLLVNRAVDVVEDDPSVRTVGELAARLATSERTLQRVVESRLGLTPKWLLQRRRMHEAVQLIKEGGHSLAQIATLVGYTDQAHFTRDVRRVTGMTPGAYARLQRP